ncbi:MAG TPA: response regulator, partial [Chloroflexota bacterium]|nr:response regulator [Chloroflexota bacterium]
MINNKSLSTKTYKILLIEDDVSASRLISTMLERGGYEIEIAISGNQGLTLAHRELPDLILCDIMMPDMNGLDVLRTLQKHSDTAVIPFIFLTALARPEDLRLGMELGADDYLTKPVQTNVLLNAVSTRLNRHQQLQANRLVAFTQRLVLSQEHQRQQMAYVLEHKINQSLRNLQFVFNMLAAPANEDTSLYNGAKEMLGEVIQQVEGLAQEMHPSILGHLGLIPTLRWLMEQYELAIELETENLEYKFDPQIEVCVFRLVQESLDNILRHAQTDKAKITLKYVEPFLEVRVEDNGIGFDLEQTLQSNHSMGLQHMHGLVAWMNGELHITSGAGEGTAVYALLPQTAVDPTTSPYVSQDLLRLAGRPQPAETAGDTAVTVKILLAIEQPLQLQGMHKLLTRN